MRIRTDLEPADRERVKAFASEHGLKMPRAYAELVRRGLEAEDV